MDEVPKQQYKLNQYIKYKYGNSGGQGVSKIRSASYMKNKGWLYVVDNPMSPNDTMYVQEKDIIGEADTA